MAFSIVSQRGEVEAYIMELTCDTEADIASLPADKTIAPGSSCLVIESSNVYILNSNREWKKI